MADTDKATVTVKTPQPGSPVSVKSPKSQASPGGAGQADAGILPASHWEPVCLVSPNLESHRLVIISSVKVSVTNPEW